MALNPSGVMSIGGTTEGASINLELDLAATANSSIGQENFRTLAEIPTGQISLSDFYGKSNQNVVPITILATRTQYTLSPSVVPGYIAGMTKVELVVGSLGSQTYLYSTDTSIAALTVTGFVAGDIIEITNNGYIMGKGGEGGFVDFFGGVGRNGGPAISLAFPCTITNNFYIGGGGGGGGGGYDPYGGISTGGGGGAGGGNGGGIRGAGGAGGISGGYSGSNGTYPSYGLAGGGGGGRIMPGVGGTGSEGTGEDYHAPGNGGGAGGAGGAATYEIIILDYSRMSGAGSGGGGGWGASGGIGYGNRGWPAGSGAGGSAGNVGANSPSIALGTPVAGGLGGKAVALNGNSVTWLVNGTRYGAIS